MSSIDTMELQVCVYSNFLQSVRKEIEALVALLWRRKKNKEIKTKLWPLNISVIAWEISFKFGMWCSYLAGTSVVKLVPIG